MCGCSDDDYDNSGAGYNGGDNNGGDNYGGQEQYQMQQPQYGGDGSGAASGYAQQQQPQETNWGPMQDIKMQRNGNICRSCERLSVNILSGSTRQSPGWKVLWSAQTTLSFTQGHLDGSIETLQKSAAGGCPSCDLLATKVCEISDSTTAQSYYIFTRGKHPPRCQFQITTSHPNIFLRHVQYWGPVRTLELFGLRTSAAVPSFPESDRRPAAAQARPPLLASLPSQNLGSGDAVSQARQWLQDCLASHTACSRLESVLPKRVLELTRVNQERRVSLYITKGELQPYCTLSYTWGETDRLVTSRVNEGKEELIVRKRVPAWEKGGNRRFDTVATWTPDDIPLAAFPQTHQQAMQTASALGFRYIWIDSLCIIQGDDADWAEQGAAMTNIYGRSALTLSATSSDNSEQGLWRPVEGKKVSIGVWCEDVRRDGAAEVAKTKVEAEAVQVYVDEARSTLDLEEKFISSRGWVFQERLVTTATLHYTDEGMVWECVNGVRLAHNQNVSTVPWKAEWRTVIGGAALSTPSSDAADGKVTARTSGGTRTANSNRVWFDWVAAYCERDLYDSRDKLPAIAGVARQFQQQFGSKYVAGLWADDIVGGLLWRRHGSTETLVPLRERYVAPSWSWASVRGRLEYRDVVLLESGCLEKGTTLQVDPDGIDVEEEFAGTFGRVRPGASLVVKGEMQRVVVDRQGHPGVRQRPHQECGIVKGFRNPENILCMLDEWAPSLPRYEEYWALRVGSYDVSGREGDVFLVLEAVAGRSWVFRRVGILETDAWFDAKKPTSMSGVLESPMVEKITIV